MAHTPGQRPRLHCWAEGPVEDDPDDRRGTCGQTCMLLRNHSGPHEWTRDDDIWLDFAADDEPEAG